MNLDWHADRSDLPDLTTLDQLAVEEPIDLVAVRSYRLGRVREQMRAHALDACILLDPVNIRYATDSTNMQLWVAHNPTRHCFVATEGPVVLFDYFSCEHLSDNSGVVDEVRPAVSWMYLYSGELTPLNDGVALLIVSVCVAAV